MRDAKYQSKSWLIKTFINMNTDILTFTFNIRLYKNVMFSIPRSLRLKALLLIFEHYNICGRLTN